MAGLLTSPHLRRFLGAGKEGRNDTGMEEGVEPQRDLTAGRRAGAMLAQARAGAKLELADVAARTRIPQRHLAAIEAGEYGKLPSRTYAVGFSRSYARLLGLDERAIAEQVRLDLEAGDPQGAPLRPDRFEPGDPARVPSRRLAWLSALAVVLLVAGAFTFYRTYFSPGLGPAPLTEPTRPAASARSAGRPAPAPSPAANGPVVFTSLADGTWVKFYERGGRRLFEGQLARGEAFTVPADAVEPLVWTGRPNALAITVGGRPVPRLGESEVVMKDVPVAPAALLGRGSAAAPGPAPGPAPTPPPT